MVAFVATASAWATAYFIGEQFYAPSLVLAACVGLMGCAAVWEFVKVREQEQELTLDDQSAKDYLKKISRDREENRVAMAIQNRHAAAQSLKAADDQEADDRRFLERSLEYWGRRIVDAQKQLKAHEKKPAWRDNPESGARVVAA